MRGLAPTVIFKIPLDKAMIAKVRISFKQGQNLIVKKHAACTIEDGRVSTTLTRAETVSFFDNSYVKLQLEGETTGGQPFKTGVHTAFVSELLNPEVLE